MLVVSLSSLAIIVIFVTVLTATILLTADSANVRVLYFGVIEGTTIGISQASSFGLIFAPLLLAGAVSNRRAWRGISSARLNHLLIGL